jgi:hypothetical protein
VITIGTREVHTNAAPAWVGKTYAHDNDCGEVPMIRDARHGEQVYPYQLHDDTISAVDVRQLALQAVAVM